MGCFTFHKRPRPAPAAARPPVLTKAASFVGSTPVPLPPPSPPKQPLPLPLPRPSVPQPLPVPGPSPSHRRRCLRSFDFEQLWRASTDSHCGASTTVVIAGDGMQTVDVFPVRTTSGPKDWLTRAETLAELEHPCLSRLLGFAIGGTDRLLHLAVYERPEGCHSLDKALLPGSPSNPGWAARLRIALGVAKALVHLQDSLPDLDANRRPTSFPDARNILVSRDGVVKLAGYGLHLLGEQQDRADEEEDDDDDEHGLGARHQNAARVVPEPPSPSRPTDETRSFGVLLLELLTGRRGVHRLLPGGVADLVQWGRPIVGDAANLSGVLDARLAPSVRRHPHATITAAREVANLALSCLHADPRLRPTMRRAAASLAALVEALPPEDDTTRMGRSATFSSKATGDRRFQVRSANGSPARMRAPDRPRFLSPDRSRISYDQLMARLRQPASPQLRRLQTLQ